MRDPAVIAKILRRQKARRSQRVGADAQGVVAQRLIAMGFKQVCPIEVGWVKVRGRWIRGKKVAGDFRAVGPGGRSVLVEAKYRSESVLTWSMVKPHQRRALDVHHAAGGMSLLAWACPQGVQILLWPVEGFGPRKSLSGADANLGEVG